MSIFKKRPRIAVLVPPAVVPGEPFEVLVELTAERAVELERVTARLQRRDGAIVRQDVDSRTGGSRVARWYDITLDYGEEAFLENQPLQEGTTTIPVRWTLPAEVPASHDGVVARRSYLVTVRAEIAHWPDRSARADLVVRASPRAPEPGREARFSSASGERPPAGSPYLDGSVARDVVACGGQIVGAWALSHPGDANRVEASLVGSETTDATAKMVAKVPLGSWSVDPNADRQVSFALTVPLDLEPTNVCSEWRFGWELELTAAGARPATTASVPVVVVPAGAIDAVVGGAAGAASGAEVGSTAEAAPLVGGTRRAAIWRDAAGRLGFEYTERDARDWLAARRAGADLVIRREDGGGAPARLDATVRHEDLRLGLLVGTRQRGLTPKGRAVDTGDEPFDDRFKVVARDADQARAFLGPRLRTALGAFDRVALADGAAMLGVPEEDGSLDALVLFAGGVAEVAEAVAAARAAIPPPGAFAAAAGAWDRLAAAVGGAVEPADMSTRGRFGGYDAEVETEWDDDAEPAATWVRLGRESAVWMAPTRELVAETLGDVDRFEAKAQVLSLALPAPLLDAGPALDALRRLALLAAALDPGGPYR
ncbi:MAG TPA: hypothetical protein VG389_22120 [Myxococcota bacterium]|nr:hypothetical protein [Myxococcota bacterium]